MGVSWDVTLQWASGQSKQVEFISEGTFLKQKNRFDPIKFTFNEDSNCWQESLLEAMSQNIAG